MAVTCSRCGQPGEFPKREKREYKGRVYARSRGFGYVCRSCKQMIDMRRYWRNRIAMLLTKVDKAESNLMLVEKRLAASRKVSANPALTPSRNVDSNQLVKSGD